MSVGGSGAITFALFQECLKRGLISMCYGPTIRINPPLVLTEAEAMQGIDILDEAMDAVAARFGLQ